jgi:septal ring factor EnvC (AmiA/AmiB activator)
MNEIAQVIGAIGGLSALVVSILYYKQDKKRKQVETKAIEIDSLTKLVHELQRDRDSMRKEIDELRNALRVSDAEKVSIEHRNNVYQRAINDRILCEKDVCPILEKLKLLK